MLGSKYCKLSLRALNCVIKFFPGILNTHFFFIDITYVGIHYCQLGHGVSCLMGPQKQGFCSKINCSQMKLLYFVN